MIRSDWETSGQARWTPMFSGVLLFLVSEIFLFGALFFVYYFLRTVTAVWPPAGINLELAKPLANTFILLLSSLSVYLAARQTRRGNYSAATKLIWATVALGTIFLGITLWEWLGESFRPWTNAYGSIFFTLTGFHALHVMGGVILLTGVVNRLRLNRSASEHPQTVELASIYWHYVDFIWILVFVSLFIVR